jgi:hypothetical protein
LISSALACEIRQGGARPFTRLAFAALIGYPPPASVAFHPVLLRTTHHRTLPRIAVVAHREQYELQPGPRRPAQPHQQHPAALHSPARLPVRSEVRRQRAAHIAWASTTDRRGIFLITTEIVVQNLQAPKLVERGERRGTERERDPWTLEATVTQDRDTACSRRQIDSRNPIDPSPTRNLPAARPHGT